VSDVRAELTQVSNDILDAIRHRNREALEAVLHSDFIQIDEHGVRISRGAFVDAVVNADFDIKALSFDSLSVEVFGAVGLVTGVQRARVRSAIEEDLTGRTAFTDVFVRTDGGWKLRVATSADLA
jgi:Domain of unknown function (DUF4440)